MRVLINAHAALALASCTVAPDKLCQIARRAWRINDADFTIAAQKAAAETWDRHCTVVWRR
jgi:hypothetical protein